MKWVNILVLVQLQIVTLQLSRQNKPQARVQKENCWSAIALPGYASAVGDISLRLRDLTPGHRKKPSSMNVTGVQSKMECSPRASSSLLLQRRCTNQPSQQTHKISTSPPRISFSNPCTNSAQENQLVVAVKSELSEFWRDMLTQWLNWVEVRYHLKCEYDCITSIHVWLPTYPYYYNNDSLLIKTATTYHKVECRTIWPQKSLLQWCHSRTGVEPPSCARQPPWSPGSPSSPSGPARSVGHGMQASARAPTTGLQLAIQCHRLAASLVAQWRKSGPTATDNRDNLLHAYLILIDSIDDPPIQP